MKFLKLTAMWLLITTIATNHLYAETRVEKKIAQFGGPEIRMRCINEFKTKSIPACSVKGIRIRCKDKWIKSCSEWATDFKQHEFFIAVTGPDAPDALKRILNDAITHAFAVAVGVAAATPGEVAIKTAAAIAAFKTTFAADLAAQPILASMRNQYTISLRERGSW